MSIRRWALTAAMAATLTSACGGGGGGPADLAAAPPPTAAPAPATATATATATAPDDVAPDLEAIELVDETQPASEWDALRAEIGADGVVPKDVALQAFALSFGPLPGVTVPAGDVDVESGTTALRWLSRYMDDVTPEQRAAIEAALAPSTAPEPVIEAAAGGLGYKVRRASGETEYSCTIENQGVSETDELALPFRFLVDDELAKLENAFGFTLGIPVYLTVGRSVPGSGAHAWASPQSPDCAAERATSCRVHLIADVLAQYPENRIHAVVAHELVHCFQGTWMAARSSLQLPDWITEGFPDFAGDALNHSNVHTNLWSYIAHPSMKLFDRQYDPSGFFFQLYRTGGDPYHRYRKAFQMRNNEDAFAYLIATAGEAFADTWAAAPTLEPERSDAWNMPDAPADAEAGFGRLGLYNGQSLNVPAPLAVTRLGHIDFGADVVRFKVTGDGHGRVNWDGGGDVTIHELAGVAYCARPGGCECPEGSSGKPPRARIPSDGAQVSAAGTKKGTFVELWGISLDDYCEPTEGVDPCVVGEWESGEWVLPGPVAELTAKGGAGAEMRVLADGQAEWDFDPMDSLQMRDPDIDLTTVLDTSGSATAFLTVADGAWTVDDADFSNVLGVTALSIGGEYPSESQAPFVLLLDGGYTCQGDLLSYSTEHPVDGSTVSALMHKR